MFINKHPMLLSLSYVIFFIHFVWFCDLFHAKISILDWLGCVSITFTSFWYTLFLTLVIFYNAYMFNQSQSSLLNTLTQVLCSFRKMLSYVLFMPHNFHFTQIFESPFLGNQRNVLCPQVYSHLTEVDHLMK